MLTQAAVICPMILGAGWRRKEITVIAEESVAQCLFPFAVANPGVKNVQEPVPLHLHVERGHGGHLSSGNPTGEYTIFPDGFPSRRVISL